MRIEAPDTSKPVKQDNNVSDIPIQAEISDKNQNLEVIETNNKIMDTVEQNAVLTGISKNGESRDKLPGLGLSRILV